MSTAPSSAADPRPARNAIACLGGLGLVASGFVVLELATEGRASLGHVGLFWSLAGCGPFAWFVVDPEIPNVVPATCSLAAWTAWIVAAARGRLSALPWGVHLFLPVAWCLAGTWFGGLAALSYT